MIQQQNQNYKAIMQEEYSGIMGGSDSFTIIPTEGLQHLLKGYIILASRPQTTKGEQKNGIKLF